MSALNGLVDALPAGTLRLTVARRQLAPTVFDEGLIHVVDETKANAVVSVDGIEPEPVR